MLPYVLFSGGLTGLTPQPTALALLLVAGIVHTGVAYALYFGSIHALKAQTAALYSYIDPVLSVILSVLVLGEGLSPLAALGVVLVLGATVASEWTPRSRSAA